MADFVIADVTDSMLDGIIAGRLNITVAYVSMSLFKLCAAQAFPIHTLQKLVKPATLCTNRAQTSPTVFLCARWDCFARALVGHRSARGGCCVPHGMRIGEMGAVYLHVTSILLYKKSRAYCS